MQTKIPLSDFTLKNHLPPLPTTTSLPISITAHPVTDLWRKPGHITHKFPSLSTSLKLSDFSRATVTFHAPWKTLYDQGGISFIFTPAIKNSHEQPPRWIKAGIEYVGGVPRVSIVAAAKSSWADWSLAGGPEGMGIDNANVTLEMVREGPSLIINIVEGEVKHTVREIAWVFEPELLERDPEVEVGAYVAKPKVVEGDENAGIEVVFETIEVWKN